MVNNLVFRWSKPVFFMVLGAHGVYIYIFIYLYVTGVFCASPTWHFLTKGAKPRHD